MPPNSDKLSPIEYAEATTPEPKLWQNADALIQAVEEETSHKLNVNPVEISQLFEVADTLKKNQSHRLRNAISCWILTHSEQIDAPVSTSIDSNGLKIVVPYTPAYNAHLPFRCVPEALFEALQDSRVVHPHDLLEMQAQRARFYTQGEAPDTETENTQIQVIAQELGLTETGLELNQAIGSRIAEKDPQLIELLIQEDPPFHLPAGYFEQFRDLPIEGQEVDPTLRTMQWFEFIEAIATHIADPSTEIVEGKRGRVLNSPGLEHNQSLRQSLQTWDSHLRESEYYSISQMTESGLRYGALDDACMMRTDVDDPESDKNNHREFLGIYTPDGHRANILLCPRRHLDSSTAAFARFSKIPKVPSVDYNLSRNPFQDMEIWFRPYQEFMQLKAQVPHFLGIMDTYVPPPDPTPENAQHPYYIAVREVIKRLNQMRPILQMHVPDFRVEQYLPQTFDDRAHVERGIEQATQCYQAVWTEALAKANTHPQKSTEHVTTLAESLAGHPVLRTVTFNEDFPSGLEHEKARFDPELSTCGATVKVVETNTLNDREIGKVMGALRIKDRDTIHCVLGCIDGIPGQQDRYEEMLEVLREFPVNIFGNENQAGAGIALGKVNAKHMQEVSAADPKGKHPENYARFLGIAPRGVVEYPGNDDLVPRHKDGNGWWALTPMDTIALNLSTPYSGTVADDHPVNTEYDNATNMEDSLIHKLSAGHHRIGLYGDGGNGTVSKLLKFCETPGTVVLYGGLGRFGALATKFLNRDTQEVLLDIPEHFGGPVTLQSLATMDPDRATGFLYPLLQEVVRDKLDPVFRDVALKDLGLTDEDIKQPLPKQLYEWMEAFGGLESDFDPEAPLEGEKAIAKMKYDKLNAYLTDFLKVIKLFVADRARFKLCETPGELREAIRDIRD